MPIQDQEGQESQQKQKWNKVEYDMRRVKDGFIGTAVLSWKNPKTQETIQVKMVPHRTIIKPQETTLEARHFAATYALHRIASDKNMQMILPTNHKKIWAELETERKAMLKKDPNRAKLEYCSNPFTSVIELRKLEEKKQKELAAVRAQESKTKQPSIVIGSSSSSSSSGNKNNNSGGSGSSKVMAKESRYHNLSAFDKSLLAQTTRFPRKVWEETIFIDLNPELRKQIERSIKQHIQWIQPSTSEANSNTDSTDYSPLLQRLGFKQAHITESLQYTTSFKETLEWLILHIPDDDLPSMFVKSDKDSNVQLKIVNKDLKKQYAIQRLTQGGFNTNDAITELERAEGDEIKAGFRDLERRDCWFNCNL
ncbi:unnamed protein product [Ambrosiozyma monospora]|uniref:Unnamed protein product n=1 Tax=Ambrosiozyma monospora TaxID=43982 RepID=A0ACB5TUR7_AMBMO|nr:unnamed protein product [Ambrosiozyma monospora]